MSNKQTLNPSLSLLERLANLDSWKQLEGMYQAGRFKGVVEYPMTVNYLAEAVNLLKVGAAIEIPQEEYDKMKSCLSNFDATLDVQLLDTCCLVILSMWREILDSRLQDEPSGMLGARTSPDLKVYKKWAGHLYDNLLRLPEVRTRKRCTDLIAVIFSCANPERHLNRYNASSPPVTESLDAKGEVVRVEVALREFLYKNVRKLIAEHLEMKATEDKKVNETIGL